MSDPGHGEVVLLGGPGELAGELLPRDGDPDEDVVWAGAASLVVPGGELGEVEVGSDSLEKGEAVHASRLVDVGVEDGDGPLLEEDGAGLGKGGHLQGPRRGPSNPAVRAQQYLNIHGE